MPCVRIRAARPDFLLAALAAACASGGVAADDREASFQKVVAPFFERHCLDCHGPKRAKGDVTLDTLRPDLNAGGGPKRWDRVLEMLDHGTMPPEGEEQPKAEERKATVEWIRVGLREESRRPPDSPPSHLRRMTNVEYQNRMRDLLGIDLKLDDELPKDPFKPYTFTNTAEFMRLGPEQLDAYRAAARRAMASVIVDPEKPKAVPTRREWKAAATPAPDGQFENHQLSVYGGGRFNVSQGVSVQNVPKTGEFRIRFQASAVFPPGVTELPLRLVMGEALNVNSSTRRIEPVGTVRLKAGEKPAVYEFRGRLENFPVESNRQSKGKPLPDAITITPQNLYDDGTLNDENGFRKPRVREFPFAVIDWIEFEAPMADVWPPEHHARILFNSPLGKTDPDEYVREVLRRFMGRAFRRPATDDEVARFAKIYATLKPELKSPEAAWRETLSLVLVSPQFLMHNGTPATVADARYAFASRLSYFLWASMPDEELLVAAAKGELDKPEAIDKQVRRMLADPRSEAFVREFSRQWLSLDKMRTVPINRDLFPRFLYTVPLGERAGTEEPYRPTIRDHMTDETYAFVSHLIRENKSVFNVVDSDFAMLNQPLSVHYGVPGVSGDEIRPVPVKAEHHLGGLLTHGSVLIGNGTGSAPHPIYRAVWLREAILGEAVPPPPADVPALADTGGASAEKATTIKDLLARHRTQPSCNACHARLDPWGIPFEHYNAVGKFQPKVPKGGTRVSPFKKDTHKDLNGYAEYVNKLNTLPVQADAKVPNGPTVDGMGALKAYLLKERKGDIARNVLSRLYAYGLGRELTWRDRFAVEDMHSSVAKGGYGMRDLITTICRHKSFRATPGGEKP
jgi:mono/diheme cytochrome c family protein